MLPIHARRWLVLLAGLPSFIGWLALPVAVQAEDLPKGERYALLVGVYNYEKNLHRSLMFPDKDMMALADVLTQAGYKRVVLMRDGAGGADLLPTASNIRKQLAAMLQDRQPADSVLVAFCGSGMESGARKNIYLAPEDARLDPKDGRLADTETFLSLATIYSDLGRSKAGTKVLLVDVARTSVDTTQGPAKAPSDGGTRTIADNPPENVAALFSCSSGESSCEKLTLGHGIFFKAVLNGLVDGKAANEAGEVTIEQLASYVRKQVPILCEQQHPQYASNLSGSATLVTGGTSAPIGYRGAGGPIGACT